jgi:hypothetical protein
MLGQEPPERMEDKLRRGGDQLAQAARQTENTFHAELKVGRASS